MSAICHVHEQVLSEIATMLEDYRNSADITLTDTLGRLLGELEGYRRNVLAADIRRYLRDGHAADSLSFAVTMQPRYDNVPGAVIQRIMDEITKEGEQL